MYPARSLERNGELPWSLAPGPLISGRHVESAGPAAAAGCATRGRARRRRQRRNQRLHCASHAAAAAVMVMVMPAALLRLHVLLQLGEGLLGVGQIAGAERVGEALQVRSQ